MKEKPNPTKSDKELLKLLKKASAQRDELRLMRIGGPRRFRYDVFSFSEENGHDICETIEALRSPNIKLIKILLANPNGESFLKRLDTEGASTWKIWRVMRHIFLFSEKLLSINNVINIALHNEELIWNLGIVGDRETLVTAYGLGTGHDGSVKEQWLSSESNGLSLAFFHYFEAISKRNDSIWLERGKDYFSSEPIWPSLFKGNAILAKEEDLDGIEEPKIKDDEVCKICANPRSNKAEECWLSLSDEFRQSQSSFRPGNVIRQLENVRGEGLITRRYEGPTLFELSVHLNNLATFKKNDTEKCAFILQVLFEDTLISLSEFQNLAKVILPNTQRTSYPYAKKICAALNDIQRHFPKISETIWAEAIVDADALGNELERASNVPFRDSHLKNRIWNDKLPTEKIAMALLKDDQEEILSLIKSKVIDIDFETACFSVTAYDDPFHILFFEHSIFDSCISLIQKHSLFQKYQTLFNLNTDLCFWRTGLARSLREYCRRLWYRNVMPKTHEYRYSLESPDYFLRLALECSSRSSGYLKLRRLLETLEVHAVEGLKRFNIFDTFSLIKSETTSEIIECKESNKNKKPQSIDLRSNNSFKVFISYSHQDEEHRKKLGRILILLERSGLIDVWHDRQILVGTEWDKVIKKELHEANIIIFLVSYSFLSSKYISDIEVKKALSQHESGQSTVVPIVVRDVSLKHTEFGHLQALPLDGKPVATWQHEDSAWRSVEEGLRKLISDMREKILNKG